MNLALPGPGWSRLYGADLYFPCSGMVRMDYGNRDPSAAIAGQLTVQHAHHRLEEEAVALPARIGLAPRGGPPPRPPRPREEPRRPAGWKGRRPAAGDTAPP